MKIVNSIIAYFGKFISKREIIIFCSLVAFSLAHYTIIDFLK